MRKIRIARRIAYIGICLAATARPAAAAPETRLDPPSCREAHLVPSDSREAGATVAPDEIERYGTDLFFESAPIDDALFARMDGRSFKAECPLSRDELRRLRVLHYDMEGQIRRGEMICNRAIAEDLLTIFRALYEARYPIARMVPIDAYDADDERSMAANNSSCFNFRFVSGTRRLSKHGSGMAVDINPLCNPCVRTRNGTRIVEPAAGAPYTDRTRDFPGKIDRNDLCYKLFIAHGFTWGGDWRSLKDYQHFEK